ncbi:hypothetical protein GQ55_2G174200 [Panicum hallii var. hallii]|uniref:Uncharacterized protein n=2 Tax=Panicum hallii TaxID=206008 RepID=A0A2T7EQ61_9POAL|nr:hypothetical protein GQ55_2G174200 [Panicum hallii var. hallii]
MLILVVQACGNFFLLLFHIKIVFPVLVLLNTSTLSAISAPLLSAGILLKENHAAEFDYKQVHKKFYK